MRFPVPLPDGREYLVTNLDDLRFIYFNYYGKDDKITQILDQYAQISPKFNTYFTQWQAEMDAYANMNNPTDTQMQLGMQGITPNATNEAGLANAQSQYNTQQAQNYNSWTMNNSLLSQGSQLEQLGLSSSGVLQTGGSTGGGVNAAETTKSSGASVKNQMKINRYNQQMGLAKSLIGAASSMASSGIYGAALGAVKHAGSQIAGAAAHSGLSTSNFP